MSKEKDKVRELEEEVDTLDTMLSSLIEILEEKGILTQDEYEKRVRRKVEREGVSLRDLE